MKLFSRTTSSLFLFILLSYFTPAMAQNPGYADKPENVTPILINSVIPDVNLKTIDGVAISLREKVAEKPTLLVFYRGGWCPYCSRHMMDLQKIEKEIVELGYQVLAISPDRPEELSKSMNKGELTYTLLSDSPMDVSKAFGIAFKMDEKAVARYKEVGIDLEKSSGYNHHLLPVPAVFIVNQEGIVKFTYVNPNYKERINGEILLTAAKVYN